MPHLRRNIASSILLCGLLAGCGAGAPATAPPEPAAASSSAPALPAPGTVALTGDLRAPGELTTASLARLPQRTVTVGYRTGKGPEKRTETGVLLADAVPATAFAEAPGKNPALSFAVLGVGADGYTALVAYGEYSPDFGDRGTMIATSEDGKPLERPRLVVPGDVKGGRYVSDLVELKVVRVAR
ncbi:hypothetical protein EV383_2202 [Pseudonocardia sediminis]|uniref:Molybdopterin-dependent oxidoreductase-like protein n=1 Tax=Pseudonocardia sediminis TaxID=1397368 RepID=A0A4Q7UTT4_PSEST|nr:molybdopterin-binding oxidoreductase [Pseudonocardia sediminis]RZT85337.1 hypothetical protein EV383_2202 [Pseudonocardia sediminis]